MANRIERFLENEEGIDIGNVVTKRNVSFLPFILTSFLKLKVSDIFHDIGIIRTRRFPHRVVEREYIYIYIYIYIVESLA